MAVSGRRLPVPDNTKVEFGIRVKQAREASELTQADVSWALGVSVKQVSFWERGQALPRERTLGALADVLAVTVAWLLGDES